METFFTPCYFSCVYCLSYNIFILVSIKKKVKLNTKTYHLEGVKKWIIMDETHKALYEYNIENTTCTQKQL
jgi:hypothetical protein